jgi:hypothetical protein
LSLFVLLTKISATPAFGRRRRIIGLSISARKGFARLRRRPSRDLVYTEPKF